MKMPFSYVDSITALLELSTVYAPVPYSSRSRLDSLSWGFTSQSTQNRSFRRRSSQGGESKRLAGNPSQSLTLPFPQIDIIGATVIVWRVKRENYQVCSAQYCAQQLWTVQCTHIRTYRTLLWIRFCLTGPISLCLDSFLYIIAVKVLSV